MRRFLRVACLICLGACEPVLHAVGIPHPEGLSAQAANILSTTWSDQ